MVNQTFCAKWVVAVANRIQPRPAAAPRDASRPGWRQTDRQSDHATGSRCPPFWNIVRRTDGHHRYNEVSPIRATLPLARHGWDERSGAGPRQPIGEPGADVTDVDLKGVRVWSLMARHVQIYPSMASRECRAPGVGGGTDRCSAMWATASAIVVWWSAMERVASTSEPSVPITASPRMQLSRLRSLTGDGHRCGALDAESDKHRDQFGDCFGGLCFAD
jgi:hypothetical protein